jgi:hypothetical protein
MQKKTDRQVGFFRLQVLADSGLEQFFQCIQHGGRASVLHAARV